MPLTYLLKSAFRRPEPLERLHSLDASFLHLEDDESPMHIAGMCTFEGPVPSRADIIRLMSSKLERIPRYRQVVRVPPLELGRPVWVDDQRFKLEYHIRRIALASPYDAAALDALMSRLIAMKLDRTRPLWELYIVEGLEGGRWALISKTHHAMVDGIAGSNLMSTLLDEDPSAQPGPPAPWAPRPEPSALALLQDAWRGAIEDSIAFQRKSWAVWRRPTEGFRAMRQLATGLTNLYRSVLTSSGKGALHGTIGKHRAYAHASVPLADVQRIRKTLGGTVNDVVLTAVAGGYRALLQHRGCDPDQEVMRSLMPVSVRAPDARGIPDNQVSFVLCDLAVNLRDPVERLGALRVETKRLKASRIAEAGAWLNALNDLALPAVQGPVMRAVGRLMHRLPQRAFATTTTNVPGPTRPLYMMGRKMLDWYPYVPISQGQRIGTAIISYAGRLYFGLTADYDTVSDVHEIARGIEETIRSLRAHVSQQTQRPPGSPPELAVVPDNTQGATPAPAAEAVVASGAPNGAGARPSSVGNT